MRLLLDSNIIVPLARREIGRLYPAVGALLRSQGDDFFVSVASLWEIAIKTRLGKLNPLVVLADLPDFLVRTGVRLLPITHVHAVEDIADPPATRDPFDKMLLVQCQVEGLRLVTTDRILAAHRLAWRAP
jgi:PIN domain nuclease of toxin-antitoxin system